MTAEGPRYDTKLLGAGSDKGSGIIGIGIDSVTLAGSDGACWHFRAVARKKGRKLGFIPEIP